jgi:branched-chain amino acid transport system permease protein
MSEFLTFTVIGIVYGCIFALTSTSLVLVYTTSGVFNFANGAIGMIGAFAYWELAINRGWPDWLAILAVLLVIAPALGALIEFGLIRRVARLGLEATITVTIALLLLLIAIATIIWSPDTTRVVPYFFPGDQVKIAGIYVTYHQLIVVGVALLIAIGLRLFLYNTRTGIATRAVVDDGELASLTGANPSRYSQLGWAMGSSIAALAGILLSALVNLDIETLALLVINGYAAAVIGRLRNLPLTFAGGIVLGLITQYLHGYLPQGAWLNTLYPISPMVILFIALLLLPPRGLPGRVTAPRQPRIPKLRESVVAGAIFVVLAFFVAGALSMHSLNVATIGISYGVIMLSLVLLTGYGGQISLCQLTFAGLGAYAMAHVGGQSGSLLGILAAVGLAGAVGAIIALPALRLRGLYLALSTLAFAFAMDAGFFQNNRFLGEVAPLFISRPHIPGIDTTNNRTYFVVVCTVFALAAVGILALRRSTFGRRLIAMGDSQAACATMGLSLTRMKLAVFTLSAGLAGLGGALLAASAESGLVSASDYQTTESLILLLLAVVAGIRTVSGMAFAGILLALGPTLQTASWMPHALQADIVPLLVGLSAIGIAYNPGGTFGGNTPAQRWRDRKAAKVISSAAAAAGEDFSRVDLPEEATQHASG